MGMRLPNEIYFLLSQGIISQKVISSLLTNAYYEQVPLVDSEELRNDVNFLMHIRSSAVNLLSANLHNYFHESPIVREYFNVLMVQRILFDGLIINKEFQFQEENLNL